jgi:hypothetical protein
LYNKNSKRWIATPQSQARNDGVWAETKHRLLRRFAPHNDTNGRLWCKKAKEWIATFEYKLAMTEV